VCGRENKREEERRREVDHVCAIERGDRRDNEYVRER
jgi:hypothetical protein